MALYHFNTKNFSRSGGNTVRAVAYRAGCKLVDLQTGETFDYANKNVEHVELLFPKDAPSWALDIQKVMIEGPQNGVQAFVDIVEGAEKRINSRVWREFEFALHRELTHEQNMALAREFVQDQICSRGMAAQLNFHTDVEKEMGEDDYSQVENPKENKTEEKPHCHVIVTTRLLAENGMGAKERDWNKREFLCELRQQWQEYSNFHLKLHGHEVSIDHRSNKARGIEMEPQPKRGKNVLEQEHRLEGSTAPPITEKAKEFESVQFRNLYRIIRKPDVVLDIATKYHATFMWADVQKILHRYVDEFPLFQRLEARLQNSKELILLSPGDETGKHAIYTTRTMLKAERALVENAEELGRAKTHGIEERAIIRGVESANEAFKKQGFGGLSQDQIKAIYHLSDIGQLKCVVGIAGAGKTTALKVCQNIWQESGYRVYGLAPTGKAAQNLEREGIQSATLHKFLKDFEEGRCQYAQNSVLVLDEAGMVDMERFSLLLGAVKQLGVKLIVVGDGGQLQPVEAGPVFRLVTERLGKSELHTVVRQKKEWQREATVLFGKQETQDAIERYVDRGHVRIVEEKLPSLGEALENNDREAVLKLYEVSKRTSSLIYREMANETDGSYHNFKKHYDFERYLNWKEIEKQTADHILKNGENYKPFVEARSLDPIKMALLFVDKKQDKALQYKAATTLLEKAGLEKTNLESLVGVQRLPGQRVDTCHDTKVALIQAWHAKFKESPEKSSLILAFSNRDVANLNLSARVLLKESGHLSGKELNYTIKKQEEDDFGRKQTFAQEKAFAVGDRIVFTRNNRSLGVKNGSLGTITDLDKQTVQVKMEDDSQVSFAPNLNPYFDQGWAITIHKSQGTTVDSTFVLGSYEMTQNLAYVSMTRHREDVQVFGSSLDFWRPEKLPEILSKSGGKLSAGDYLDATALNKLMQEDDSFITKIFTRLSNELEAMGAVSKKVFWDVADHFLGIKREKEIQWEPDFSQPSIREEVRAEKILKPKEEIRDEKVLQPKKGIQSEKLLEKKEETFPDKSSSSFDKTQIPEARFSDLVTLCEKRLYGLLETSGAALTLKREARIVLQAERTATFILHSHGLPQHLPREKEMVQFSMRAKFELDRLPEIQKDLIDEGEESPFRACRIADRLASIEGRLTFEAMKQDVEPPLHLSYVVKKELERHREQLPHLAQELTQKHFLSETAAQHCAQDILRYKETHGDNPSEAQIIKMVQISREVESKEYRHLSSSQDAAEIAFLRRREGDLLFKHGSFHDATDALTQSQKQVNKSLEFVQRQIENERMHTKPMELWL